MTFVTTHPLHAITANAKALFSMDSPRPTPEAYGVSVTPTTQCAHWHSPLDIIAIKHFCCNKFYACISCHDELEDHKSGVWPLTKRDEKAVLCGQCKHVLSITEYMGSGSQCTQCGSGFNPGCKGHWGMYFELDNKQLLG
ncbi:hypothetical protein NX059_010805 [Plenodomus lindquistii]|nr:hypothetical protein NX059_010805 [Plenodomus lindquistii]